MGQARAEGAPSVILLSMRKGVPRYVVGQHVLTAMKFPSSKAAGKENACKNPKQQKKKKKEVWATL